LFNWNALDHQLADQKIPKKLWFDLISSQTTKTT